MSKTYFEKFSTLSTLYLRWKRIVHGMFAHEIFRDRG